MPAQEDSSPVNGNSPEWPADAAPSEPGRETATAVSAVDRFAGFRSEVARVWSALPHKSVAGVLLLAWLALFHFLGNATFGYIDTASLPVWLYQAYNAPGSEDGHGMLIPFVVLVLAWWKREELVASVRGPWPVALVLVGAALLLHVIGYVIQQPRLSVVALFGGLYALTGLLWGPRWLKASFFPFFLFAFCVPVGALAESITFPLRMLVTQVSVAVGQGLGIGVVSDGTRIFNEARTFQYDVAPACSGIRSLVALLALTTIYGFVSFQTWWKRLVMALASAPLAVLGNVVRISAVIVAGQVWGQEAGAAVEQKLGFVTFAVAIVCVLLLARWLREEPQAAEQASEATASSLAAIVSPARQAWVPAAIALLLIVGAAGVTLRLKAAQRLGEPGVKVEALAGSTNVEVALPSSVLGCESMTLPITPEETGALPKDTSFGRRLYQAPDGFQTLASVVLMGSDRTSIHNPRFCLNGQGWQIDEEHVTSVQVHGERPYALPVMKVMTTRQDVRDGVPRTLRGVYVFWFVADDAVTASHGERMWWMARELFTFFSVCEPGHEEATWQRMQEVIAAAVPEFQTPPAHAAR
jgi:exosortase